MSGILCVCNVQRIGMPDTFNCIFFFFMFPLLGEKAIKNFHIFQTFTTIPLATLWIESVNHLISTCPWIQIFYESSNSKVFMKFSRNSRFTKSVSSLTWNLDSKWMLSNSSYKLGSYIILTSLNAFRTSMKIIIE